MKPYFSRLRIWFIFAALYVLGLKTQAQDDRSLFALSIGAFQQQIGLNSATGFGVALEVNIDDIISLRYPVYLGFDHKNRSFYVNTGWPQAIGGVWMDAVGSESKLGVVGMFFLVIPESISLYLPLSGDANLIPYFSPYNFERYAQNPYTDDDNDPLLRASMPFGVKLRWRTLGEKIDLMPHVGGKWIYGKYGGFGLTYGLDLILRWEMFKPSHSIFNR